MITTLAPAELDLVRGLRRELHEHHAAFPTPPGFAVRDPDEAWVGWRDAVRPILDRGAGAVLVHRDGDVPDGMAYVRLIDEPKRPVIEPRGGHGELVTLVVAAAARGAGVGAELNAAAADWCRGHGLATMHVVVRADNEDALRFYRREGARAVWTTLLLPLDQPTV